MEKIQEVKLISKHWQCSEQNVYKLMRSKTFQSKLKIIKLGSMVAEKNITDKELEAVFEFMSKMKGKNGSRR
jgi:hypothetical protein